MACSCGCRNPGSAHIHRVIAALIDDDIDGALRAGLLMDRICAGCAAACTAMLLDRRASRRDALAARKRFSARQARLARRQHERLARKTTMPPTAGITPNPSLPAAAAAALARAKAKAAGSSNR